MFLTHLNVSMQPRMHGGLGDFKDLETTQDFALNGWCMLE